MLAELRPFAEGGRYAPHDPAQSVLRQVVRTNLPRLVEEAEDVESGRSHLPSTRPDACTSSKSSWAAAVRRPAPTVVSLPTRASPRTPEMNDVGDASSSTA